MLDKKETSLDAKGRWSVAQVNKTHDDILGEIRELLKKQDSKEVLRYALEKIDASHQSPQEEAEAIFYAIGSIILLAPHSVQAFPTVKRLEKIVKALLARNKVRPRKSQLAHIYGYLSRALSYFYQQQGMTMKAMWQSSVGITLSRSSQYSLEEFQSLDLARLLLYKGSSHAAIQLLHQISTTTNLSALRDIALIEEIQALRLSDRILEAENLLGSLPEQFSPIGQQSIEWERTMLKVLKGGYNDWQGWLSQVDITTTPMSQLLKCNLCLLADKSIKAHKLLIKPSEIRRASLSHKLHQTSYKYLLKIYESFLDLYNAKQSFESRLVEASEILANLERVDVEARLMAQLALLRWLIRNDQRHLALVLADEYESLSLRLSRGTCRDILGAAGEELRVERLFQRSQSTEESA